MEIYELGQMSREERRRVLRRSEEQIRSLMPLVQPVVEDVRRGGDEALIEYTARFDGADIRGKPLRVQPEEFVEAHRILDVPVQEAIRVSYQNIREFHARQMPHPLWMAEVAPGVMAGEKTTPVPGVGLYVPRGKGAFPSVMLMLGTPARVAGVPHVVVCTPPGPDGRVDAATLVAAATADATEVYRVGGAQAVAAMAFGTETVPKVDKIVGPGSGYVSAAKRLLYGEVDVGLPAGPSEAIILADETAPASLAAADLLVEAEHGPDSVALLVTHHRPLAEEVNRLVPGLIETLPEPRRSYCRAVFDGTGGVVLTESLEASIAFVNDFAPEHLEVLLADPFGALRLILNAGEILLGRYTPIPMCNFSLGPSAILPTGGFARSYSGVSVMDFLKRSSVSYLTAEGFLRLRDTVAVLAEYEGFPAHARALGARDGAAGGS